MIIIILNEIINCDILRQFVLPLSVLVELLCPNICSQTTEQRHGASEVIYLPQATSSAWHTVRLRLHNTPGSWAATRFLSAPWASAALAMSSWTLHRGWPRHVGHVWTRGKSCWPWLLPLGLDEGLPKKHRLSGRPELQIWPDRDSVTAGERENGSVPGSRGETTPRGKRRNVTTQTAQSDSKVRLFSLGMWCFFIRVTFKVDTRGFIHDCNVFMSQ